MDRKRDIPAANGAAADVPVCSDVHPLPKSVVTIARSLL